MPPKRKYIVARTIKVIVSPFLRSFLKLNYKRSDKLREISRPYFIFGNHTTFFDPFILSVGNPVPVNFVTNDEYFRFRTINFLLKLTGAVPKTKFMTDAVAVRNIFRLKRDGSAIGIYPEGGRTWQGRTQPVLFPTAKLVKKLEIPVVVALTKGAALSTPRWAKKFRRGRVLVNYDLLLTPEQIREMTVEEIFEAITESLRHDEAEWQRQEMIPFRGKRLAERLEWFLYACPKCGGLESMTSSGDLYSCSECGYTVKYNVYGFFVSPKDGEREKYDNVNTWNDFQYSLMREKVQSLADGEALLQNPDATLLMGTRGKAFLERVNSGVLTLTNKGLRLESSKGASEMDFQHIEGIIINHKNTIDFYYNGIKLRITLHSKLACGYVWEDAVKALKQNAAEDAAAETLRDKQS